MPVVEEDKLVKMDELRGLPNDEIQVELDKARGRFFKERFQAKGTTIENPGVTGSLKKDIARMLTVLRERELKKKGLAKTR